MINTVLLYFSGLSFNMTNFYLFIYLFFVCLFVGWFYYLLFLCIYSFLGGYYFKTKIILDTIDRLHTLFLGYYLKAIYHIANV